MKKEKVIIAVTIGLMSFVLLCVMFMQFKVVNETDIAEIESMREEELQSALSEWKEKYEETQEDFWIRKILWAISLIKKEGKALTWNHIHKKIHISASNFQAHDKYFREKLGDEVIDAISPR